MRRVPVRILYLLTCLLCLSHAGTDALADHSPALATPLEQNEFKRISTSAEISAYLDRVVAATPLARKDVLGSSVRGLPIEALVLRAGAAGDERLRILITGSQHGAAEPAGGEALLVLARDLAFGALRPLLDDVEVILLPNANPDGRDLGQRSNAHHVNINTDFVLAREPETRALQAALLRYVPHAVLDSHESAVLKRQSLGREGYLTDFEVQFEIANNPGVPSHLRALSENHLLPALLAAVSADGYTAHRYIGEITSIRQPVTNGGLTLRNFRNSAGVQGILSFLVETRLDSSEGSYPTWRNIAVRNERQLSCLRAFLAVMHERRGALLAALAAPSANEFPLYAAYHAEPGDTTVEIALRRRATSTLEWLTFRDHRRVEVADVVSLPASYLVTAAQDVLRPILDAQGIEYTRLDAAREFTVQAIRFRAQTDPTARIAVFDSQLTTLTVPPGTLLVNLDQAQGRRTVLLLDPRSSSSVFRYPEFAALLDEERAHFIYPVPGGVRDLP